MFHALLIAAAVWLPAEAALAQHRPSEPSSTPYAGLEARPIKALSGEQIADLKAGRGMGLALPAELNGYPGPIHVIEHAEALGLSPEQRVRVQNLYEAMKREAVPLGERLIAQEADLDRLFADRVITASSLDRTTAEIGQTQASLRAAHLRYHLTMINVLTPEQVRRYAELRGYAGQPTHRHGEHGRH
jgi:hypothetical protein